MKQQAEQELIKDSVRINETINRAKAMLPFLCDSSEKLVNNTRSAEKRLESVVRKYKDDKDIKNKLVKSKNRLINKGHIKFMDALPD